MNDYAELNRFNPAYFPEYDYDADEWADDAYDAAMGDLE